MLGGGVRGHHRPAVEGTGLGNHRGVGEEKAVQQVDHLVDDAPGHGIVRAVELVLFHVFIDLCVRVRAMRRHVPHGQLRDTKLIVNSFRTRGRTAIQAQIRPC